MDDEVVRLRSEVREQRGVIDRLEARLARVEQSAVSRGVPVQGGDGDGGLVVAEGRTDRRHLLAKAATATVGAVVGGAAMAIGQASPAGAASGTFDGNPAVTATASPGDGTAIVVTTSTGTAIEASRTSPMITLPIKPAVKVTGGGVPAIEATGSPAILATGTSSAAVQAFSVEGRGVMAGSTEQYGLLAASQLRSQVMLDGFPPPPLTQTDVEHLPGEIRRDTNNDLWACVGFSGIGTPGAWRRVAGPSTAGSLVVLPSPVRVYDSRPGLPPTGIGPKTPSQPPHPAPSTSRTTPPAYPPARPPHSST
jgi:hypothetical protein